MASYVPSTSFIVKSFIAFALFMLARKYVPQVQTLIG